MGTKSYSLWLKPWGTYGLKARNCQQAFHSTDSYFFTLNILPLPHCMSISKEMGTKEWHINWIPWTLRAPLSAFTLCLSLSLTVSHSLSLSLPLREDQTLLSPTPFLINFPFDSNFGVCVEFFLYSLPKDPLLSVQDLVSLSLGGKFALSCIRLNFLILILQLLNMKVRNSVSIVFVTILNF